MRTSNTNALTAIIVLAEHLDRAPLDKLRAATRQDISTDERVTLLEQAGDQLRWETREPAHATIVTEEHADTTPASWLVADALTAIRRSWADGDTTTDHGDVIVRAARRIQTFSEVARADIDITLIADGSPIDVVTGINNLFDHSTARSGN